MAEGGDGGAGGGEGPFKEIQQHSHLRCPGVLLGLAAIAQAHFSTASSQEMPAKILTAPV